MSVDLLILCKQALGNHMTHQRQFTRSFLVAVGRQVKHASTCLSYRSCRGVGLSPDPSYCACVRESMVRINVSRPEISKRSRRLEWQGTRAVHVPKGKISPSNHFPACILCNVTHTNPTLHPQHLQECITVPGTPIYRSDAFGSLSMLGGPCIRGLTRHLDVVAAIAEAFLD